MSNKEANILEIFYSIQGEGILVGLPFIFVRFSECNLRCNYCDTKFSWDKKEFCNIENKKIRNPVSIDNFIEIISNLPFEYLSFTGGEPLINSDYIEESIKKLNKKIFIETNGTLYEKISDFLLKNVNYWSIDIKLPSVIGKNIFSLHYKFFEKLINASGKIIAKVIFSKDTTLKEIEEVEILSNHFYEQNKNISLVFQPLTVNNIIKIEKNQLDMIYNTMKNLKFEVRLIPQIHKILKIP